MGAPSTSAQSLHIPLAAPNKRVRAWAVALCGALAMIAVELITVERQVGGNPELWQYGFPLPYTQWFSGSSMYTLLCVPSLVIDWLAHIAALLVLLVPATMRVPWRALPIVVRFAVLSIICFGALTGAGNACMTSKTLRMPPSDGAPRVWIIRT